MSVVTIREIFGGLSSISDLSVQGTLAGVSNVTAVIQGVFRGRESVTGILVHGRASGAALVRFKITGLAAGWYKRFERVAFVGMWPGNFRLAQQNMDRYELYVGVNGAVNYNSVAMSQAAVYVDGVPTLSPALEYTITAPVSGTKTYRFVLRLRNQWNLASQNIQEWVLVVDSAGAVVSSSPGGAGFVSAKAVAGGVVQVSARYAPGADGTNAANQWLIYYTTNGSTPNPASLSPVVVDMTEFGGDCRLDWMSPAQTEGTVVKALIRTRRSGTTNFDSASSAVVSATATLAGPSAPVASGFIGSKALQTQ